MFKHEGCSKNKVKKINISYTFFMYVCLWLSSVLLYMCVIFFFFLHWVHNTSNDRKVLTAALNHGHPNEAKLGGTMRKRPETGRGDRTIEMAFTYNEIQG